MALWMTFLLGRQAMFGQEPPTYFRSTTTVFIPFLARVQERSLPAAPLPRMSRSYSSALIADAVLPLVAGLSTCSVVSMSFSCLVIRSAGLHTIKLLQSRNNIIRIKPAGGVHIHPYPAECFGSRTLLIYRKGKNRLGHPGVDFNPRLVPGDVFWGLKKIIVVGAGRKKNETR